MKLLDNYYKTFSKSQKNFLGFTVFGFTLISILGLILGALTIVETLLIFLLGFIFMNSLKLEYRLEFLEDKKSKHKK